MFKFIKQEWEICFPGSQDQLIELSHLLTDGGYKDHASHSLLISTSLTHYEKIRDLEDLIMPEYMINGIPVNFPVEPYNVQTTYMEKVIECLKQRVNGMLESPTGTGKTFCLLCASLSWLTLKKAQMQISSNEHVQSSGDELLRGLQNEAGTMKSSTWINNPPQIIYASRTHSQLTQVIQELKKSGYGHIKAAVLGSREQLCIHPEVSKLTDHIMKIKKCQALTKSNGCYFEDNLKRKTKSDPNCIGTSVMDIEDLVKVGQKQRVCPYFLARGMIKTADIIFIPYNYILDKKRMRTQGIALRGNVVILDEAHNIEKMCEESVSMKICSTDIALCILEVTKVMEQILQKNENNGFDFYNMDDDAEKLDPEQLCLLKTVFLELEKAIDEIELKSEELICPGSYIIDLLAKAQITRENCDILKLILENIIHFLSENNSNSPFQFKGAALQKLIDLLNIAFMSADNFSSHVKSLKTSFKVHVTKEEIKKDPKHSSDSWNSTVVSAKGKAINLLCFTPSFGIKQLIDEEIRCVILTSGTLSPLPALISELGIPIPVTLENPHVIGPGQVNVTVIKKGPDGYELNSSFKTRNDPKYISSLGNAILNISRIVPHGLLVFFPSYPIMYKCKDGWQESGLWSKIYSIKPIFVEPKGKDTFTSVMKEYYEAIQNPLFKGACFMAVTRGKVSEGLDFMDVNGRAVVVTGIPYPPMMDPYVKLKKEYLSENQRIQEDSNCLNPDQWYLYEATRAINQAIGRIIRHKNDYGAILLCDIRFQKYSITKALSSWVQPHVKMNDTFGPVIRDLRKFFVHAQQTLPPPKISGPSVELKLPTAVGASFDLVAGHSSKSARTEVPTTKDIPLASDVMIVEEYRSSSSKRGRSPESGKEINLFGALEKPTVVINFNDMTAACSSKAVFNWCKNKEPAIKTKKLKVAPPKILPLSQESMDTFSAEGRSHVSTSRSNIATCSKLAETSGKSTNCEIRDKALENKTSENTKCYLNKVRKSLDSCTYKRFKEASSQYYSTKNFKILLSSLQDILLAGGRNYTTLFREFRCFVRKQHREEFDKYCSKQLAK